MDTARQSRKHHNAELQNENQVSANENAKHVALSMQIIFALQKMRARALRKHHATRKNNDTPISFEHILNLESIPKLCALSRPYPTCSLRSSHNVH